MSSITGWTNSDNWPIEWAQKSPAPKETWAICLDSDDHALLIPRKLYLVRFGINGVWVRDEKNEMTVCDKEDFLPLAFAPEV